MSSCLSRCSKVSVNIEKYVTAAEFRDVVKGINVK